MTAGFDRTHVNAALVLTDAERVLCARRRELEEIRAHDCRGGICAEIDALDEPELDLSVRSLEYAIDQAQRRRAVA